MKRIIVLLIILATYPFFSYAEIEKYSEPCSETGVCFYSWPKLPSIQGWHHDRNHSFMYSANIQVADGHTFADTESVIYAKAINKPGLPEKKSLDAFINDDEKQLLSRDPSLIVSEVASLTTADGQKLRSYTFFPKEKGNWEQTSYGEEGDFYLIFTISSRSKEGFQKALPAYKKFINNYKKKL